MKVRASRFVIVLNLPPFGFSDRSSLFLMTKNKNLMGLDIKGGSDLRKKLKQCVRIKQKNSQNNIKAL